MKFQCNPFLWSSYGFLLLYFLLFAVKNSILRNISRLRHSAQGSKSQTRSSASAVKVRGGRKSQGSVNKVLQLHDVALGKKATVPYEYTNGQFKNQFQGNDSEHNFRTEFLPGLPDVHPDPES